jgi:hypothetical protein
VANDVEIVVKSTDRSGPGFDSAKRRGQEFSGTMKTIGATAGGFLAANFVQGVGNRISGFFGGMIDEAREAQKVSASTAQGIKTIGAESWTSAKAIEELSGKISEQIGVDDELIQQSANLLLTFKNIKNEAGEGGKVFDRAVLAAQDLAAKGFGDAESAAKMLGKALNDPIKGMTALGKAGVTFSEDQKAAIKSLVESGDLLGAQKIILKEVEAQVGGTAEATATAGDKMAVSWKNFQESLGTAVMPTIDGLLNMLMQVPPGVLAVVGGMAVLAVVANRVKAAFESLGGTWRGSWSRSLGIVGAGVALLGIRMSAAAAGAERFAEKIAATGGDDTTRQIAALNKELEKQTALQGPNIGGWLYFTQSGKEAGDRVDALKDKIGELTSQQEIDAAQTAAAADAHREAGKTIEGQKQDLEDLVKQYEDYFNVILSNRDAHRQFEEAIDAAQESIKKNGKTLDIHTEKGRENEAALDAVADSAFKVVEAMQKNGDTAEDIAKQMQIGRDEFIRLATQLGLTKDQAAGLATKLGLIPGNYTATINANTAPAEAAVSRFSSWLNALLKPRSVSVTANLPSGIGLFPSTNAHGGIIGAAGGGPRGLTWVNEQGPELQQLPNGSVVIPHSWSQQIMSSAFGGGRDQGPRVVQIEFVGDVDSAFASALLKMKRDGLINFLGKN